MLRSLVACVLLASSSVHVQTNLIQNGDFDASPVSVAPRTFTSPTPAKPQLVMDDAEGDGVQAQTLEVATFTSQPHQIVGIEQQVCLSAGTYQISFTSIGTTDVGDIASTQVAATMDGGGQSNQPFGLDVCPLGLTSSNTAP